MKNMGIRDGDDDKYGRRQAQTDWLNVIRSPFTGRMTTRKLILYALAVAVLFVFLTTTVFHSSVPLSQDPNVQTS
ncbi:hypothetical protein HDV00_002514 [Rhizophlyctis rosea]|nr:hypothetical protein HDV00_002514 [Rhizophlyctis rosea]